MGSVAAIRLLLDELRRDGDAPVGEPDALDFIDRLAARRSNSNHHV